MKNKIQINLGTDHALECTEKIIGRSGEGLVSTLAITVPASLTDFDAYIDFEKPNGEVLRTPKLEVRYGVAYYDVPQYLLFESGEIKVQLVFIKGKNVWKSSKKRYTILKSINASDEIPDKEDFISQAQAVLDELSGEVQEIADVLADNADFAQSVIDACGGQTKITTINGKTLRFFVDTQEEYDKLSEAQKQNLFAIITDDTAKERMEGRLNILEAYCGFIASGEQTVGQANKAKQDLEGNDIKVADYLKTLGLSLGADNITPDGKILYQNGTLLTLGTTETFAPYTLISNVGLDLTAGCATYNGSQPDSELAGRWQVIGKCGAEKQSLNGYELTILYYLIVKVGD